MKDRYDKRQDARNLGDTRVIGHIDENLYSGRNMRRNPQGGSGNNGGKGNSRLRIPKNREIMIMTYVFLAIFLSIIAYIGWFMYTQAEGYRTNAYNSKRQSILSSRYIRGDIVAEDGTVLATTKNDEAGEEYREYPYGAMYAHTIGYSQRGMTGVEASENTTLLSSHSNTLDNISQEILDQKVQGDIVTVTLNTKLQEAAYEALGDSKGAVVAIEPSTGKVLAMVSKPDFDPNDIVDLWESINSEDNTDAALVNRAAQGLYAPGSTFKILVLLEYLRENPDAAETFTFDCDSTYESGGYTIRCAHGTSHGEQTLGEAFSNSCNGAFAKIGESIDWSAMYNLCNTAGYNMSIPADFLTNEGSFTLNGNSDLWSMLQTAIGQGSTVDTPLHICLMTAAVANGGTIMQPYIVSGVTSADGRQVSSVEPRQWLSFMTADEAEILKSYMKNAVQYGTGVLAYSDDYTVYGKTGTAEYNSNGDSHAWFTGYASTDNGDVAVCVIVEGGESGGDVAAPIAKEVFDALQYS